MSDAKQTSPDYITDESGHKKAVVLSVDQYQELLEDLDDLGVIAERRDEATITHEELIEELRDEKLQGTDHTFRVRIGEHRVIFNVDPSAGEVTILRVRHRREAYR